MKVSLASLSGELMPCNGIRDGVVSEGQLLFDVIGKEKK